MERIKVTRLQLYRNPFKDTRAFFNLRPADDEVELVQIQASMEVAFRGMELRWVEESPGCFRFAKFPLDFVEWSGRVAKRVTNVLGTKHILTCFSFVTDSRTDQ